MSTEPQVGVAEIGVTGLAVMGRNLARNFARHGFVTAVHNRSKARTRSLVADHGDEGTFVASESLEGFVASLAKPRKVVEQCLAEASGLRQPVDVRRREAQVLQKGERLLQPGRHQESAASRQLAHEELEYRSPGIAMIQVGLHHVELIEVGEQRIRRLIHLAIRG